MPRLVIASKNPDKIPEIEAVVIDSGIAGEIVDGLDWPDVEETGESLEENALLKARAVVEAVGLPVMGDDTGLEVRSLGGAPGVFTARYAGPSATYEENVSKLLAELGEEADRTARFRTVVALAMPDGVEVVAEGVLDGVIARRRRGSGGFGYDPVFEVSGRTLAEMTLKEKNELSHRARAIRALAASIGVS
ncbi:MAG: RdgB/HAM1 family non-canonical purine NTP pyrophosphatase [Acidimicrobiia bacterium]